MRNALVVVAVLGVCALAYAGSTRPASPPVQHTGKEAFYGHVTLEELNFTCDCDFPSVTNGYSRTCDNPCSTPNAKLGDPCVVGAVKASPDDGGSAFNVNSAPRCSVVSDGVTFISVHNFLGDGGALDLPDAGYTVQIFAHAKQ